MNTQTVFEKFSRAFQKGLDGIQEAAEIYVEAIDKDSKIREAFIAKFDHMITPPTWRSLELIGRHQVHPQLMLSGAPNARYIKRLAYSEQEKILNGTLYNCTLPDGDIIKVDLRTVDSNTADQMFNYDCVRTVAEQKLYIKQRKPKKREPAKNPNYEIVNGGKTIRFLRPCEYTKKELEIVWRSLK